MSVTCTPSALVIRGILMTRTISRSAITSVSDDPRAVPHVNWRDTSGKDRWSPLLIFESQARQPSFMRRAKTSQLESIREWYLAGSN
jgi:hypothetical protein